jgi:hypothetical protein
VKLVLCSITDAKRFVGQHHRHNAPPVSALFALAIEQSSCLVAAVMEVLSE